MHGTGIEVDPELKRDFINAQTSEDTAYLKIEIVNEKSFKKTASGKPGGSFAADLKNIAKSLEARKPSFVTLKTEADSEKWLLLFYMPDNCSVRDRMVYAASSAALKLGLGGSKFISPDFTLRDAKECSPAGFEESRKKGADEDVLTMEERMANDAAKDSILTMSIASSGTSKLQGMSELNVKTNEGAISALQTIAGKGQSTAVLFLDPSSEELSKGALGNIDISGIAKQLPEKEPRYVVYNFKHTHPEEKKSVTSTLFIYYCPNNAPPRLKMFYSSSKSNILKLCEKYEIAVDKNIEVSEIKEVTNDLLMEELYPKKVESTAFKKPTKPGRAGGAKFAGAKFNADAKPGAAAS